MPTKTIITPCNTCCSRYLPPLLSFIATIFILRQLTYNGNIFVDLVDLAIVASDLEDTVDTMEAMEASDALVMDDDMAATATVPVSIAQIV